MAKSTETKARLVVALCFIASRIYASIAGLRFEGTEWQRFWHFVDPKLLENSLLESIYYLHSQPPLPNLVMGLSLKLFGTALPSVFSVLFLIAGVFLTASMYLLMRRVQVAPWIAAMLTSLWCASPAMLLFENFLFYTYPVLALLLGSALVLHVAIARQSQRGFMLFFGLIATIALTRALFHPIWVLSMLSIAVYFSDTRKRTLLFAIAPILLIGSVMIKNRVEFGSPSLSSWRGMNVGRAVLDRLPAELRDQWVAEGKISPWARVGSFKTLDRYPNVRQRHMGVAVLDQIQKSNGRINLHHHSYLQVSRQLERDARFAIRERPGLYIHAIGISLLETMQPAASYRALKKTRAEIRWLERMYDSILGWSIGKRHVGIWPLALPLLIAFGFVWIARAKSRADRALWIFILVSIIWVIAIGAMVERTENARFRFLIDPFLLLIFGRMLSSLLSRIRTHPKNETR